MAGLDRPDKGRILFDGKDMTGVAVQKRNVAMVYQQFINYPAMTVYENIASPLKVTGADKATIRREVGRAAELLRLTPYLDRTPLNLSGGQQQRTALARAMVKKAGLVLLDEPLANLDYKLREELREELPKIFAESGAIFVYATTEPSEALLLGGSTATLSQGRVTQFGPTVEVFRNPVDLVTAMTFADPPLNTIALTKKGVGFALEGGVALPAPQEAASAPDGLYTVGFQPHHLTLRRTSTEAVAVRTKVTITEITGSESFVHLAFADASWVMLAPGIHIFQPDEEIDVFIDPRRLMVFDSHGRAVRGLAAQAA